MAQQPPTLLLAVALGLVASACFGPPAAFVAPPSASSGQNGRFLEATSRPAELHHEQKPQEEASPMSWASSVLSLGAALGMLAGIATSVAPVKAITAEQFSQLTWQQTRGSGLANRCPTVEQRGSKVEVPAGSRMKYMCFEPKSFAVEAETDNGKEFVTTRLLTGQTYTIDYVEGSLNTKNGITFSEEDGMDFQAVTVKLPDGEYVPFLFTVKKLQAKGSGDVFKPGFTWGGEFEVPSYRTGSFLDSKGRGMYTGYDQAVALPALEADGRAGQEELFKAINKVFDTGKGAMEMEVNKVNEDLNEIGGVFVSKQPGDTDMGAKEPKTILLKGIFYGKVIPPGEENRSNYFNGVRQSEYDKALGVVPKSSTGS